MRNLHVVVVVLRRCCCCRDVVQCWVLQSSIVFLSSPIRGKSQHVCENMRGMSELEKVTAEPGCVTERIWRARWV